MPALVDASALVNLVVSRGPKALGLLKNNSILDLTLYEAGNSLWKLSSVRKLIATDDAKLALEAVRRLADYMEIISVLEFDHASVFESAKKERISFYDAAYLNAAAKGKMLLVTDDKRLARVASRYVETSGSSSL